MHNRCVISFCGCIVHLFYIFVTKEKNCVIKNLLPNFNDLNFNVLRAQEATKRCLGHMRAADCLSPFSPNYGLFIYVACL